VPVGHVFVRQVKKMGMHRINGNKIQPHSVTLEWNTMN